MYASGTPGNSVSAKEVLTPDAPALMSVCMLTCGASAGNKAAMLLTRIASPNEMKTEPPKNGQNITSDVSVAASCTGKELWIAIRGVTAFLASCLMERKL
jgi:hypothetical protein